MISCYGRGRTQQMLCSVSPSMARWPLVFPGSTPVLDLHTRHPPPVIISALLKPWFSVALPACNPPSPVHLFVLYVINLWFHSTSVVCNWVPPNIHNIPKVNSLPVGKIPDEPPTCSSMACIQGCFGQKHLPNKSK